MGTTQGITDDLGSASSGRKDGRNFVFMLERVGLASRRSAGRPPGWLVGVPVSRGAPRHWPAMIPVGVWMTVELCASTPNQGRHGLVVVLAGPPFQAVFRCPFSRRIGLCSVSRWLDVAR